MDYCLEDFPFSLFSEEMKKFLKEGPDWSSVKEMQNSKTLQDKGWEVRVHWDDEFIDNVHIGIGVFADQQIPRGTVVRRGVFGQNALPFNQYSNVPNLEKSSTVEYLRNYRGKCPCKSHMILFVPGISVNHSTEPNVVLSSTKEGLDLIAIKDIKDGENLRYDYRTFGTAPDWFLDILKNGLETINVCLLGATIMSADVFQYSLWGARQNCQTP